jgi:hyperosmotically inducible periplasmic protein
VAASHEELVEKINTLLESDPRIAPYGLKARVYENGAVQIQGIVDVLEERHQAETLLRELPEVKVVENNITVCTDGAVDDGDVAFEVGEELRANPEVPESVGAKVSGGEVRLVGNVKSRGEAEEAVETAGKARGVREVRSELKITGEFDDATITNNVQSALLAEPALSPGKVKLITVQGIVTLWGELPHEQANLAEKTAAGVPGVKGVKNEIIPNEMALDDRIVIAIMEQIAANPYLNELSISIEVEEGQIILSGSVDSPKAKKDIEGVIHQILEAFKPVVFKVDNKLRLEE